MNMDTARGGNLRLSLQRAGPSQHGPMGFRYGDSRFAPSGCVGNQAGRPFQMSPGLSWSRRLVPPQFQIRSRHGPQRRRNGTEAISALTPFHMICTPMQINKNVHSRMITAIVVGPMILERYSENP